MRFKLHTRLFMLALALISITPVTSQPAMFGDNLIALDLSPLFSSTATYVNGILSNTSALNRFESDNYCAYLAQATASLLKQILNNPGYAANAFESKKNFFSCQQILELFCNPTVANKYVVTHSVFDCLDYLSPLSSGSYMVDPANSTYANWNKIVTLGPSTFQLSSVLANFLTKYSITHYAVVYASATTGSGVQFDLVYYQQLAANLIYKLSVQSSFYLDFSFSLYDQRVNSSLANNVNSITKFFL